MKAHSKSLLNTIFSISFFLLTIIFPNTFFSQSPNLGACSSFAIFSAVGAIDNTGNTTITGNIGTNVGAFNGFPPGEISGEVHVADSESAQAAIDVDVLYSYFIGLTCDTTLTSVLGNNQNLIAKTYCINTAASLNDTLILDGQNNSDALFIFKINGAFSTSVYATVILINEAQPKNIFWQVNGLFTLGNYSKFKGTIITDGANSLLSNSSVEGRILSKAGAISMANNEIVMNFNDTPLPIELLAFNVECKEQKALVKWSTASESNNDYFTIEYSPDLQNWDESTKINGAGNSSSLLEYQALINLDLTNQNYFRLKQTDFDGHFRFSKTVLLESCCSKNVSVSIFPNPTSNIVKVDYKNCKENFESLLIFNSLGEKVFSTKNSEESIDLSKYKSELFIFRFVFSGNTIYKSAVLIH
jgi:hypothetical protein